MVNENINFKVDNAKCIKCNLCVKDCTMNIIEMKDYPEIKTNGLPCIECEHCLAICPTGAISILNDSAESVGKVISYNGNPEEIKNLVLSRRSIRQYKNENIDKALIRDLCETALLAPTAKNENNTLLTVIDDKKIMDDFRNKLYDKFNRMNFDGTHFEQFALMIKSSREKSNKDKLLAGAPHMIIASAPADSINIFSDPVIILSYFEILANSNNIGTLWNGIMTVLLNDFLPELKNELGIPEEHRVGYVMVFGPSAVKYQRGINRKTSSVNYIKDLGH